MNKIEKLPIEISLKIFDLLEYEDIIRFADTNEKFNKLFNENKDLIFSRLIKRDFLPTQSQEEVYIMLHKLKNNFIDLEKLDLILDHLQNFDDGIDEDELRCFQGFLNHTDPIYHIQEIIEFDFFNINLYIKLGYDINSVDQDGNNILLYILTDEEERDEQIIEIEQFCRVIDINAVNNEGDSALLIASRRDSLENLESILKCNPDINVVNNKGENVFSYDNELGFHLYEYVKKNKLRLDPDIEKSMKILLKIK